MSGTTLDNWASKIANFMVAELELEPGDTVVLDLPATWQALCIILGAQRAGVRIITAADAADSEEPFAIFTVVDRADSWASTCEDAYIVVVTDDVFGRGVVECGISLPDGAIDFGPEVRLQPDAYLGIFDVKNDTTAALIGALSTAEINKMASDSTRANAQTSTSESESLRLVSWGWQDPTTLSNDQLAEFVAGALCYPWLNNGCAIVVRKNPEVDAEAQSARLHRIAEVEKATIAGT